MLNLLNKSKPVVLSIALVTVLIIGIWIVKDYGISYDEFSNRILGLDTYHKVISLAHAPSTPQAITHGSFFELILVAIEKGLSFTSFRDIFLMRHFVSHCFFLLGVLFFYYLCRGYFKDWKMGLLGGAFLYLSPRIFADSFYNTVDIGALVGFIIASFTMILFLQRKTYSMAFVHGLVTAAAIDIRMTAVLIAGMTAVFSIQSLLMTKDTQERRMIILRVILYLSVLSVAIVIFNPDLWHQPFKFFHFVTQTAQFRGLFRIPNLYFDHKIWSNQISWEYNFVWIAITTPILYLGFFVLGVLGFLYRIVRNKSLACLSLLEQYALFWFFAPILLTICLKTFLYDGWRHLFFIYPALIFIALIGWDNCRDYMKKIGNIWLKVFYFTTFVSLVLLIYDMKQIHPHQNVYFNQLAPPMKSLSQGFDKDYWEMSAKQAFEYILKTDPKESIKVCGDSNHLYIMPQEQQKRILVTDCNQAEYSISNYRYSKDEHTVDLNKAYHVIKVHEMPIMVIMKLKGRE